MVAAVAEVSSLVPLLWHQEHIQSASVLVEQLERDRPLDQKAVVLHSVLSLRPAADMEVATESLEDSPEVPEEVAVVTPRPPPSLIRDLVRLARETPEGRGQWRSRVSLLPEAEAEALEQ